MRGRCPSRVFESRCRAGSEEGSTVVSTVKDTRVANSLESERRFAAKKWDMRDDVPPKFQVALPRGFLLDRRWDGAGFGHQAENDGAVLGCGVRDIA